MSKIVYIILATFLITTGTGLARETRVASQNTGITDPYGARIVDDDPETLLPLRNTLPEFGTAWDYFERTKGFQVSLQDVVRIAGRDKQTGEAVEIAFVPFVNPRRPQDTYNVVIYSRKGSRTAVMGGVLDLGMGTVLVREDFIVKGTQLFSLKDRLKSWAGCTVAGCVTSALGCKLAGPAWGECTVGLCGASAVGCAVVEVVREAFDKPDRPFGPPPPGRP